MGAQEMDVRLPQGTDWIRVTTGANDALVGACAGGGGMFNVVQLSSSIAGKTTVQLTVDLDEDKLNVYAAAGTPEFTMAFPPAFQVAAPFGADTGGVNPAFVALNADAEFDSWITVGVTDASATISMSPGLDGTFDTWNEANGFSTTNGAIFWMSPPDGPQGTGIVIAQITAPALRRRRFRGAAQPVKTGLRRPLGAGSSG